MIKRSFKKLKWINSCIFLIPILLILFTTNLNANKRGIDLRIKSPEGREVKGDLWLFVIGINNYIKWPRLRTAVNDARAVRDVLISRYHFEEEQLIELYNEEATRKNILDRLRYLAVNVEENDSLIIFYAGHGHLDSITKEGSWIPVESDTVDVSAWISNHDIKNYMRVDAIRAKHILLISDSCFAGDFFRNQRAKLPEVSDETIKKAFNLTSRQAITSGGIEPVSDDGFGLNSVFSHFLVTTLKENQKPFLIPSDFFPDIAAGVEENAGQFPRLGSLTGTGGQRGGEIVLFLNQKAKIEDLTEEIAIKHHELASLKEIEAAVEMAQKKDRQEIAIREQELAELDRRIQAMKERLNTPLEHKDDGLSEMHAMIRKKEERQRLIEKLREEMREKEVKRKTEIAKLKQDNRSRLIKSVKNDIKKYEEIISSPFGEGLEEDAWISLVSKYAVASKELNQGDTAGLLFQAAGGLRESNTQIAFVWVPGGCYEMGCGSWINNCNDNERPAHEICIDGFWISRHEVTQSQWKKVMKDNPSRFKNGDNYPVEQVSWDHAKEFIKKLNALNNGHNIFRLPTESEWEYAARNGGKKEKYAGGDDIDRVAWNSENSEGGTHPVGTKAPNGLGIYDMSGNVWEWCEDVYSKDAYHLHQRDNPVYMGKGFTRVSRGGGYNTPERYCRSTVRFGDGPDYRRDMGFRLVMDP